MSDITCTKLMEVETEEGPFSATTVGDRQVDGCERKCLFVWMLVLE